MRAMAGSIWTLATSDPQTATEAAEIVDLTEQARAPLEGGHPTRQAGAAAYQATGSAPESRIQTFAGYCALVNQYPIT
jgi:hypothetical protein